MSREVSIPISVGARCASTSVAKPRARAVDDVVQVDGGPILREREGLLEPRPRTRAVGDRSEQQLGEDGVAELRDDATVRRVAATELDLPRSSSTRGRA
jgi:hypothetical protein